MNTGMKKLAVAATFGMAVAGLVTTFPADGQDTIRHEKMKEAGVVLPITNVIVLSDSRMQFEIRKDDVPMWGYIKAKMFGRDFAYYLEGTPEDESRECPYIEKKQKTYFKMETLHSPTRYRVTIGVSPEMLRDIILTKCAITPDPDEDTDVRKNENISVERKYETPQP